MYARSVRAKGRCDVCGFTYLLSQLKPVTDHGRKTGARACPDCLDPDHPLNKRGTFRFTDPQTLRDPRPDADRQATTSYFGWAPIGNPNTRLTLAQGSLTILTED